MSNIITDPISSLLPIAATLLPPPFSTALKVAETAGILPKKIPSLPASLVNPAQSWTDAVKKFVPGVTKTRNPTPKPTDTPLQSAASGPISAATASVPKKPVTKPRMRASKPTPSAAPTVVVQVQLPQAAPSAAPVPIKATQPLNSKGSLKTQGAVGAARRVARTQTISRSTEKPQVLKAAIECLKKLMNVRKMFADLDLAEAQMPGTVDRMKGYTTPAAVPTKRVKYNPFTSIFIDTMSLKLTEAHNILADAPNRRSVSRVRTILAAVHQGMQMPPVGSNPDYFILRARHDFHTVYTDWDSVKKVMPNVQWRAALSVIHKYAKGWFSHAMLKAVDFFGGSFSPNEAKQAVKVHPHAHKSASHLKRLTKSANRKEAESAHRALDDRLGVSRGSKRSAKSTTRLMGGKKSNAKSYDQGYLTNWLKNLIGGESPLDHMKSSSSLCNWIVANPSHSPTAEELRLIRITVPLADVRDFFNTFQGNKRLLYLSLCNYIPSHMMKFEETMDDGVSLALVGDREFVTDLYDDLISTEGDAPMTLLEKLFDLVSSALKATGPIVEAILSVLKKAFETVKRWISALYDAMAPAAIFMRQVFYDALIKIGAFFGVIVPQTNVSEPKDHELAALSTLEQDSSDTRNLFDDDNFPAEAASSRPQGKEPHRIQSVFANMFGPYNKLVSEDLTTEGFMTEIKNANSIMTFLNGIMTLFTKVVKAVTNFGAYLLAKLFDVPLVPEMLETAARLASDVEQSQVPDLELSEEFVKMYYSLVNMAFHCTEDPALRASYTSITSRMHRSLSKAMSTCRAAHQRKEPFAIHIVGAAGLGKTTLVPILARVCLRTSAKETASRMYNWDSTGYQDSYVGQDIVVINDIFNEQNEDYDVEICSALLQIVSNNFWPVPVASPEKKGCTPINAKLVMTTSNALNFPCASALRDPDAYRRRRSIVVEVVRSPGLNVLKDTSHPYNDYLFVVKNRYDEADQALWTTMNFLTFIRYVSVLYSAFEEKDEAVGNMQEEIYNADHPSDTAHLFSQSLIAGPNSVMRCSAAALAIFEKSTRHVAVGAQDANLRDFASAAALARDKVREENHKNRADPKKQIVPIVIRPNHALAALAAHLSKGIFTHDFKDDPQPLYRPNPPREVVVNLPGPTLFERICNWIVINRATVALLLASSALSIGALAFFLQVREMPSYSFHRYTSILKSDAQNVSGSSQPKAVRSIKTVARRIISQEQDQSIYFDRLSRNLVPLEVEATNGSKAYMQGLLLHENYMLTNVHSMATVDDLDESGKLQSWTLIWNDGSRHVLRGFDFEKDLGRFEGSDLCMIRLPESFPWRSLGTRSVLRHFVSDSNEVRVGAWTFTTLRKMAGNAYSPGIHKSLEGARITDVTIFDNNGKAVHTREQQYRFDVESSNGLCGSLLLGGTNSRICGLHVSGGSHHADFAPICAQDLVAFIRSVFDPKFAAIVTTSGIDPVLSDPESVSQSQAPIEFFENDSNLVFLPTAPRSEEAPSSSGAVSLEQGLPFSLPLRTPADNTSTRLSARSASAATLSALQAARFAEASDPSFFPNIDNPLLLDPPTSIPPSTELPVESQLWSATLLEAVDGTEQGGSPHLAVFLLTESESALFLSDPLFWSSAECKETECPRFQSSIASKTNGYLSPRPSSARHEPFPLSHVHLSSTSVLFLCPSSLISSEEVLKLVIALE